MAYDIISGADHDMRSLTLQLDKAKAKVFTGSNNAFLAPLMCSLNFQWTTGVGTASTDGVSLNWNPDWFLSLVPAVRLTVLIHELWHCAKLHGPRRGNRDHKIWNEACDIHINNALQREGMSFEGVEKCCIDPAYGAMLEEEIYDALVLKGKPPQIPWPGGQDFDIEEHIPETIKQQAIANVVQAVQQAQTSGVPGMLGGQAEVLLKQFLDPIVAWDVALQDFMQGLLKTNTTWRRPSRRSQDMYLPSRFMDKGQLNHLIFFEDTSGSISDQDMLRFNSEVAYIWDHFKPKRLTLVMFDTKIAKVIELEEGDEFNEVVVVGRGGTHLECVREYITMHEPTAAVVFSDLGCTPMRKLQEEIPIIWVAVNAPRRTVPFGTLIHINT